MFNSEDNLILKSSPVFLEGNISPLTMVKKLYNELE